MTLEYGMSIRPPYRPEYIGDLADQWIAGNKGPALEAQRLHEERIRCLSQATK